MEIIGFCVRLSSSLLWIQIYRLGVSHVDTAYPSIPDYDSRNRLLSPTATAPVRQTPEPDEVLSGSIYDPAYYSSLFEDSQDVEHSNTVFLFFNNDFLSASVLFSYMMLMWTSHVIYF